MSVIDAVCADISVRTGEAFTADTRYSIGGGSINEACQLRGRCGRQFFVKLNAASMQDMFAAEADGLEEMASANAMRIPTVVCHGVSGKQSYLVLEYIAFTRGSDNAFEQLGEQLVRLHRKTARQFGWHRDNTIGATPQPNAWCDDWLEFLRDQRLGFQAELAARNGGGHSLRQKCDRLLSGLDFFFESYRPEACLLHGDLWSGNYAFDEHDQPVIFDPAVYYGDRESDLAMTELFGGFAPGFYEGYNEAWPLESGYPERRDIYQLFHLINHLTHGPGYAGQVERILQRFGDL